MLFKFAGKGKAIILKYPLIVKSTGTIAKISFLALVHNEPISIFAAK